MADARSLLACSLVCPTTFEGAHGNLIRLFERNRRRVQELNQAQQQGSSALSPEQQRQAFRAKGTVRFLADLFISFIFLLALFREEMFLAKHLGLCPIAPADCR